MGCGQSVETEEDRRQKNRKRLDDLRKEEEKQAARDAKAVANFPKNSRQGGPVPERGVARRGPGRADRGHHRGAGGAEATRSPAQACQDARRQGQDRTELLGSNGANSVAPAVGKGKTEPNYWGQMGQIR